MKKETYKYYSRVYDMFDVMFPHGVQFVLEVLKHVHENDLIAEVGGGTASSTRKLVGLFPNVKLTFIEPSPEMMAVARERLADVPTPVTFIQKPLDETLPDLVPHDLFIFQRSLYSFYGEREKYVDLARRLYRKTAAGGRVAIYELGSKYDIGEMNDYIRKVGEKLNPGQEGFEESVRLFIEVMQEFNDAVDSGIFTLFQPEELVEVFRAAGFGLISCEETTYFFEKE